MYSGTCISYLQIPAESLDSEGHSYFGGKSGFVLVFAGDGNQKIPQLLKTSVLQIE